MSDEGVRRAAPGLSPWHDPWTKLRGQSWVAACRLRGRHATLDSDCAGRRGSPLCPRRGKGGCGCGRRVAEGSAACCGLTALGARSIGEDEGKRRGLRDAQGAP